MLFLIWDIYLKIYLLHLMVYGSYTMSLSKLDNSYFNVLFLTVLSRASHNFAKVGKSVIS